MYLIKLQQEIIAAIYQLREQKKKKKKRRRKSLVRDAVNEMIKKERTSIKYCEHMMPPELCGFCPPQKIVAK